MVTRSCAGSGSTSHVCPCTCDRRKDTALERQTSLGPRRRDSRQNPDAPWADGQTGLPVVHRTCRVPAELWGGSDGGCPGRRDARRELVLHYSATSAHFSATSADYSATPAQDAGMSSTAAFAMPPQPQTAPGMSGEPGGPGGLGGPGVPPGDSAGRRRSRGPQKALAKIAAVVAAFAVVTGGGIGAWAMTSGGSSTPAAAKKVVDPKMAAAAMPPLTPAQIKAQQSQRRKTMADEASRAAQRQSLIADFISKGSKPAPKHTSSTTGNNSNNSGSNGGVGDPMPSGTAAVRSPGRCRPASAGAEHPVRLPGRPLEPGEQLEHPRREPVRRRRIRSRCPGARWPAQGPTGRTTPPLRSSGASATSPAVTEAPAAPGATPSRGLVLRLAGAVVPHGSAAAA